MIAELKENPETKISNRFNLAGLTECGNYAITKSGQLVATLQLTNSISDKLDNNLYEQLFKTRKQAFDLLDENIIFSVHSIRMPKTIINNNQINNITINKINNIWNEQFTHSFETRYFLIITTQDDKFLAKTIKKQQYIDINKLEQIKTVVDELKQRLHQYGLKLLINNEIINYWSNRLNCNCNTVKVNTATYLFDDYIFNIDLFFPAKKNYFEINNSGKNKYSCILSIKAYPTETSYNLFTDIQALPIEFSIYQHYEAESLQKSLKNINDRINRIINISKFNQTALAELQALQEKLQNDELKLYKQTWYIQIFANSLEQLNNNALRIQTTVERRNLLILRETKNTELAFWSIFPGYENLRIRKYQITSDNLAHFVTFSSDNSGLTGCSWGPHPVAKFYTEDGALYNFAFHESVDANALGNTIVIGGSGIGKTTLISFLLSQAMKFDNFKTMCFDRGFGLRIFADFVGGSYMDFSNKKQNINPLQLTEQYRPFLQKWLIDLLGKNDDEALEIINDALNSLYELDKNQRNLDNIKTSFGKKTKDSIRSALETWLPTGANGSYFNGDIDALDFSKSFVFFDTTIILDNPSVLGALADYLFFRLKTQILDNSCPYAIFVDELNKYLASKQFAPKLKETAEEIRKTNGVLIMAIQSAAVLLENQTFKEMQDNIATYILFPSKDADPKYYMDGLGLNSAEFSWIKTTGARQVMVKKKNAPTVVLNIDLSILDKHLQVFNSSSDAVNKQQKLKKVNPDNWIEEYLQ